MNVVENQGKTFNEALEKVLIELNANQSEVIYKKEETDSGLFKSSVVTVKAVMKQDLLLDIKDYLKSLVEGLGLKVEMEAHIQDDTFCINMDSDNNPILIGKNGQTLKALETIIKQKYLKDWNTFLKINLDVEDYKTKRVEYLEKLAIRIAKEVRDTKIDVALDNMNSYERRIVHNKLADFKGIRTTSEGEEPNRHIVIKAE